MNDQRNGATEQPRRTIERPSDRALERLTDQAIEGRMAEHNSKSGASIIKASRGVAGHITPKSADHLARIKPVIPNPGLVGIAETTQ